MPDAAARAWAEGVANALAEGVVEKLNALLVDAADGRRCGEWRLSRGNVIACDAYAAILPLAEAALEGEALALAWDSLHHPNKYPDETRDDPEAWADEIDETIARILARRAERERKGGGDAR